MKNLIILLALIGFIGISCTKQKPEDVAVQFYNYLNSNSFDKAKELASPSAKEYIDKLADIVKGYPTSDTVPIQIMDVRKKESTVQGDTAIVNYKFRKFKSFITLVWMDGNYKVSYTDELKALRIITVNSIEFFDKLSEVSDDIFTIRYAGVRYRISNLLYKGIPFDPATKTAYSQGAKEIYIKKDVLTYCNSPLTLKENKIPKTTHYSGMESSYNLDFIDKEEREIYVSTVKFPDFNLNPYQTYNFIKYFGFEGVLEKASFQKLNFKNCEIINLKDCK